MALADAITIPVLPGVTPAINMPAPPATPSTPAVPSLANSTATPSPQPSLPAPLPVTPVTQTTSVNGTAGVATAKGYDPTPYIVPEKGLVQNQIKDIIGHDSPLMQQARVHAMEQFNARGLANSTLNTEAGENAVISQALPIASQDAASITKAMGDTATAKNTASQFGAAADNAVSQVNAQLETSMNTTNANAKNNALAASAIAENTRNLAAIDNNNKQALAVLSQQNSELLQTNANAANMFQETVKNIAAISVSDTMTQAAKDAAVATQLNLLSEGMKATGHIGGTLPAQVANLGLENFFQPTSSASGTGAATFTPAQKAAQIASLNTQITAAQAHYRDVAQNGTGVPVLSGPDASARRRPLWEQAAAAAKQALDNLIAQRDALK